MAVLAAYTPHDMPTQVFGSDEFAQEDRSSAVVVKAILVVCRMGVGEQP